MTLILTNIIQDMILNNIQVDPSDALRNANAADTVTFKHFNSKSTQ